MKWYEIAWKYIKRIIAGIAIILAILLVSSKAAGSSQTPNLKKKIKEVKKDNDTLVKQIAVVKETAKAVVKEVEEETAKIVADKAVRDAEAADIFNVGDKDD